MNAALAPGFADPVLDTQRAFRALLAALSHPGSVVDMPSPGGVPAPFMPATAGLALTLLDLDAGVYLDHAADTEAVRQYLRFHCGCPLVTDPARAAFAFLCQGELPKFSDFCQGDAAYPDRSATLVIQVADLIPDAGVKLTGPGIETETLLDAPGLDPNFWPAFQAQRASYPLGVDVFLVAGTRAVGLPRSLTVEF